MTKQDMLKVQTCVLRVHIHCEGCMHKVKKKLQKVKGVYKVNIDSQQGKVTVSGNADPASLIEKLEKAGKHAELWGPQKGHPVPMEKPQHKIGNGFVQIPHKKEEKHSGKDHKSVRFNLPEEDDEEDDEFDDDEEEDDDDDLFDDEFEPHKPHKPAGKAAAKNAHHKGSKGGIDVFLKSMLKKAGRKNGDSDKKSKKGKEDKKGDNGKDNNGGKKGGFELQDFKKGKNDSDSWSKKDFDGGKQQHQQQHKGFTEMKLNHKGGGGGGGRNMEMIGKKEAFPGMNDGRFMGAGPGNNPYSQQQQMAQMMMMMNQQQRENGHGAYHPAAYARPPPPAMVYGPPPPAMSYGPPPPVMSYGPPPAATEQYTHMFSDENTDSCSIM